MIKKDVVDEFYDYDKYQSENDKEHQTDSMVDDIFAAADQQMESQNKAAAKKIKNKKKRHPIRRFLLSGLITLIITVVIFCVLIVNEIKKTIPTIKESLLTQITEMQEELLLIDDEDLTVDQYYQKQIMLLLSTEDIEKAVNDIGDIRTIVHILATNGEVNLNVIPEDKIDEYNKIMYEYRQALQDAEEYESTIDTTVETLETNPNN